MRCAMQIEKLTQIVNYWYKNVIMTFTQRY